MTATVIPDAHEADLAQQTSWLIRRCAQLRPWMQQARPDVIHACVSFMKDMEALHLEGARQVQACQQVSEALQGLGCPSLIWSSHQSTQVGPWIGCAPQIGWFILHARQSDGHWLFETMQGVSRRADWPTGARVAALPLSAGWRQEGSARALVMQVLRESRSGLLYVALCSITANLLLLAKRTIVVIEDEPHLGQVLKHIMAGEGFDVRLAKNRAEIVSEMRQAKNRMVDGANQCEPAQRLRALMSSSVIVP